MQCIIINHKSCDGENDVSPAGTENGSALHFLSVRWKILRTENTDSLRSPSRNGYLFI